MTEKEMNQLADIIVDKLIEKQKEYDEQFHIDIQETMMKDEGYIRQLLFSKQENLLLNHSTEELLLAEIGRLMTLLSSYEDKEQYEKAAIIKNKIDKLKNKLENL